LQVRLRIKNSVITGIKIIKEGYLKIRYPQTEDKVHGFPVDFSF